MSWLFSQALVEASSAGTCLDGDASAQLSVMPTQHKFWRNDKTMEHSDLSRFGLTCAVLTEDHGAELLTSYLAGFPVKTSAQAEPGKGSTEPDRDYGERWSESFAKLDPNLYSWRTPQLSLLEDSEQFSETWPRSGSMRNGTCFRRPTLAPTTYANVSGLLPTPTKSWAKRGPGLSNNLDNLRMSLGVTQTSLAIVKAVGWRWPASFVEWMMGWPSLWTELRPLEMDKFREWQQQHGRCSVKHNQPA